MHVESTLKSPYVDAEVNWHQIAWYHIGVRGTIIIHKGIRNIMAFQIGTNLGNRLVYVPASTNFIIVNTF